MKNLFFTLSLILTTFCCFSAKLNAQINFKINSNNELVWSKVYDSHTDIQSQEINLVNNKKGVAIYLRDIHSADLIVQHRANQTRVLVKNIKSFGAMDNEPSSVNRNIINSKKGEFRKFFLKRDIEILNDIIERSVTSLLEENSW